CVNTPVRFSCECLDGYKAKEKGEPCLDRDECTTGFSECPVTYLCQNTPGSYKCICPSGYRVNDTDRRCDDIDECSDGTHKCDLPSERCINLAGSHRCECNGPAYVGSGRECVDNNECETKQYSCPEYALCRNTVGSYECNCDKGFRAVEGKGGRLAKCEDIDECADTEKKVCPGASKCINKLGTYECQCVAPQIQHGPQDCLVNASCPSSCHRDAHCLKSERPEGLMFNCTCNIGYKGDGVTNCEPINECIDGTAQCHSKAECIDLTPLYTCKCTEPFEGDGKNQCKKKDVCKEMNDCPHGCKCIPLDSPVEGKWVSCDCNDGKDKPAYSFNATTRKCDDIDECLAVPSPCPLQPKGVRCENTQGSYKCICPDGYKLSKDGKQCDDIDECVDIGQQVCEKSNAACVNTLGSFECNCTKGFRQGKDKKSCINIDECAEKSDDCDKKTSSCRDSLGGFECECTKGLAKIPGKTNICEDVNECVVGSHNCHPLSQLCHNTIGSYACNCSNGYVEKGAECVPFSNCPKDFECGTNAFCVMRQSREEKGKEEPECVCQDGYYGKDPSKFCDPVPDCEGDNQCPSNAKCVESQAKDGKGKATFLCVCNNGYRKTGSQCEPIDECKENENLCGSSQVCVDLDPLYKCICAPGTQDVGAGVNNVTCVPPKCDNQASPPCHSDADCVDTVDGYVCKCRKGFRGAGTAKLGCALVDQCAEYQPCSQYATCVNEPRGSVTCTCKGGYTGNGTMCYEDGCVYFDV
ncbi:hypothetical protein PMAYCL1PPCAC_02123, partial [Pristionchus mayeri]